jgi:hypothetical protein
MQYPLERKAETLVDLEKILGDMSYDNVAKFVRLATEDDGTVDKVIEQHLYNGYMIPRFSTDGNRAGWRKASLRIQDGDWTGWRISFACSYADTLESMEYPGKKPKAKKIDEDKQPYGPGPRQMTRYAASQSTIASNIGVSIKLVLPPERRVISEQLTIESRTPYLPVYSHINDNMLHYGASIMLDLCLRNIKDNYSIMDVSGKVHKHQTPQELLLPPSLQVVAKTYSPLACTANLPVLNQNNGKVYEPTNYSLQEFEELIKSTNSIRILEAKTLAEQGSLIY